MTYQMVQRKELVYAFTSVATTNTKISYLKYHQLYSEAPARADARADLVLPFEKRSCWSNGLKAASNIRVDII